ncbi:uncharacterized protein LOC114799778 [Denticeps clupeoides]|uniref:uncharacterized protein LOC114799778 n=1 Tax=Denticeps clupeoides TaxID=299321 RepID=UPI0010A518B0|nr:uncharacterized protein LOC114799778 [Denticeps clupeoides]
MKDDGREVMSGPWRGRDRRRPPSCSGSRGGLLQKGPRRPSTAPADTGLQRPGQDLPETPRCAVVRSSRDGLGKSVSLSALHLYLPSSSDAAEKEREAAQGKSIRDLAEDRCLGRRSGTQSDADVAADQAQQDQTEIRPREYGPETPTPRVFTWSQTLEDSEGAKNNTADKNAQREQDESTDKPNRGEEDPEDCANQTEKNHLSEDDQGYTGQAVNKAEQCAVLHAVGPENPSVSLDQGRRGCGMDSTAEGEGRGTQGSKILTTRVHILTSAPSFFWRVMDLTAIASTAILPSSHGPGSVYRSTSRDVPHGRTKNRVHSSLLYPRKEAGKVLDPRLTVRGTEIIPLPKSKKTPRLCMGVLGDQESTERPFPG